MADFQKQTVVIVDADADFLQWASKHLAADSVEILAVSKTDEALKLFTEKKADLLIAEIQSQSDDAINLLREVRMNQPNAMVILNGPVSSTNTVIEAMRLGAFDVLRKESINFELRPVAERALQTAEEMRRASDSTDSEPAIPPQPASDVIIGRSAAMQDVYKLIGRVARADAPVLITGESGVGKEVVARATHQFSRRAKAEYVTINCAAIPSNLLESELFGHEKGSFTGAVAQRTGRFEQCNGGTLFLDEIGDMPLEVQGKLLRVLQSGEFSRVGGNQTLLSDVRILAATNKRLEEEVEGGNFREDLFYRLNVVRIHIPPLRKRPEDVSLLAGHFLASQAEKGKSRLMQFSKEAIESLETHQWPGNVRELENLVERACLLASGNVLLPADLPFDHLNTKKAGESSLSRAASQFVRAAQENDSSPLEIAEQEIIAVAMAGNNDDVDKVAALLGLKKAELEQIIGGGSSS